MTVLTRRAALAAAAGQTRRPNFLFFFPDQWRHDWTGFNPALPLKTPNLARLAAMGTRFEHCLVASPLCAPSRACLASGQEYDECRVPSNGADYPLDQPTYYQQLRDAGYHTMACGKVDLHKKTKDWGLDGKRLTAKWGFSDAIDNAGKGDAISSVRANGKPMDPYMDFLQRRRLMETHIKDFGERAGHGQHYANTKPTPLPDDAYCDNYIGENGLTLLRRAPKDQPWHLVLNFTGPHAPLDITKRMEERRRTFPQPNRNTEFTAAQHVAMRQNYAVMCENIDRWLGIYLEELRRRGELEHTVIVFSSDHGEMLGDHDRWGKTLPYHASVGVPLVVAGPGVQRGRVSGALVSHIDLGATFLAYAGAPLMKGTAARDLRPVLTGQSPRHREVLRAGLGDWRLAFDGRYKLVRGFEKPGDRLFDLRADPAENVDLADRHPAIVKRLAGALRGQG